jgi:exosortase/archaeosortase family protein
MFLAAALAAWRRLGMRATLKLLVVSVALAMSANIARAATLFFPESGLVRWPGWTHEAVGIGCFILAALPLVYLADKWDRPYASPPGTGSPHRTKSPWPARAFGGWVAACSAVVLVGLFSASANGAAIKGSEWLPRDWPETWDGHHLVAMEPDAMEEKFSEGFPGEIRRFALPDGQLILRRVTRATRMLHPTSHCLRASGFRLLHQPVTTQAEDGGPCLRYQMTSPDGKVWDVTEYVRGPGEHSFRTDSVSKWYWHALLHPSSGPWEAVTVMSLNSDG